MPQLVSDRFISFTGRNWEQRRRNGSPWVIKEVTKFIRGGEGKDRCALYGIDFAGLVRIFHCIEEGPGVLLEKPSALR